MKLDLVKVQKGYYACVCKDNGLPITGGTLVEFTSDGFIKRLPCVKKGLGIKRDEFGRIREKEKMK